MGERTLLLSLAPDPLESLYSIGHSSGSGNAGTFRFSANLRLDRNAEGPVLRWTDLDLPGQVAHWGNLAAADGQLLVRSTSGLVEDGNDSYWLQESVLAAGRSRGGPPFPRTPREWSSRIAVDLRRFTDLLSATPDPGADGEGRKEFRELIDGIESLLGTATLFPLEDHREVLLGLDTALRSRGPAARRQAERLLRRNFLARLAAGDGEAASDRNARHVFLLPDEAHVLARLAASSEVPAVRRAALVPFDTPRPWLTTGSSARMRGALDAGRLAEAPALREALRSYGSSSSPWAAGLAFVGPGLLLVGALLLTLRPRVPVGARLRPAAVLLAASLSLPWLHLEFAGLLLPTTVAGVVLVALASWVIASAGAGWARYLPAGLFTVGATGLLLGSRFVAGGEPVAQEFGVLGVVLGALTLPALAGGLNRPRKAVRGSEPAVPSAGKWFFLTPRGYPWLQGLGLLLAVALGGGIASLLRPTGPAAMLTGLAGPGIWFAWVWWTLWTAAGKRAGTPSLAARAWARLRRLHDPGTSTRESV